MQRRNKTLGSASILMALSVLAAAHAAHAQELRRQQELVIKQLHQLQTQQNELEIKANALEQQKAEVSRELADQKREIEELRNQLAQVPPKLDEQKVYLKERIKLGTTHWGARTGYQTFPFAQKGGGFFYQIFFDHRLLSLEDGLPFGDLDGEIGIGYSQSSTDHLTLTSALLKNVNSSQRQQMASIWATFKYYPHVEEVPAFHPYLTFGPGIWADIITTPPLAVGQVPIAPQLHQNGLPVVGGADAYGGIQTGTGFNWNLKPTHIPLLEKTSVGFDYRFSLWQDGQLFHTFAFQFLFGQ